MEDKEIGKVDVAQGYGTAVNDNNYWVGNQFKDRNVLKLLIKRISLFALVGCLLILVAAMTKHTDDEVIMARMRAAKDALNALTTEDTDTLVNSKSGNSKPNFIFVLVDDLAANSVGSEITEDLEGIAPTLTSMAKNGVFMSNYYAQEVCSPSRASLMTGRLPITIGMQYEPLGTHVAWGLQAGETIIPEILKSEGGYRNYMLGKWDLGHYTDKQLPVARGFDDFLGFMQGENYYWSKRVPADTKTVDIEYGVKDCEKAYRGDDMSTYSTFLYRDKAIAAIKSHDFKTESMFMYLSFQAVHDPFEDTGFEDGIPQHYLETDMYNTITSTIVGRSRQQYAMALHLLDSAIQNIYGSLVEAGQADNSYLIFASDNGGCYASGGRNGPLRGTKGSLFEGGTKVDAFLYSPLLPTTVQGTRYSGLMHVSDWLPTIMDLADITYIPADEAKYALDGVSHASALLGLSSVHPREYLLYNMYHNVESMYFSPDINGSFAIRNRQYKLIHSFVDTPQADWYEHTTPAETEDDLTASSLCQQVRPSPHVQEFSKMLFDLSADPFERNNLIDNPELEEVREALYERAGYFRERTSWDMAIDAKPTFGEEEEMTVGDGDDKDEDKDKDKDEDKDEGKGDGRKLRSLSEGTGTETETEAESLVFGDGESKCVVAGSVFSNYGAL